VRGAPLVLSEKTIGSPGCRAPTLCDAHVLTACGHVVLMGRPMAGGPLEAGLGATVPTRPSRPAASRGLAVVDDFGPVLED
jgi:hypothetical protein